MQFFKRRSDKTSMAYRLGLAMATRKIDGTTLSARSGVSQSGISTYLNSKAEPTRRTAGKLAEALGVSTDWLLGIAPLELINNEGLSQEALVKLYESLNDKSRRYLLETAILLSKVHDVA